MTETRKKPPRRRINGRTERIMFTLSAEDIRLIRLLAEELGETTSQVVKRSVIMMSTFYSQERVKKQDKENNNDNNNIINTHTTEE